MKKMIIALVIAWSSVHAQEVISLNHALVIALKHNPEIAQTKQEIRAASGRFWSGISLPQPEVSLSYEYLPLGKSLGSFGERTLEVSQDFEFPTAYFLRGRALNAETAIARAKYRKTTLAVLADVKRSYWIAKAREQQTLHAAANAELAEEFNRKASIRYTAGEGTWLEKLTASVQRTQAQNSVAAARNEEKAACLNLMRLLGRTDTGEIQNALSDSLRFHQQSFALEELKQTALLKNPELKMAEYSRNSRATQKMLAWSGVLPGFKLAGSRQALEGGGNDYYGISFGASIPLWFLFDQRGRIEEASAELKGSEYEYAALKNTLFAGISEAFFQFVSQEQQIQLFQQELLPQADEIYRTAAVSYDAGEIGYLEYVQSKQTLASVKSGHIDALLAYNLAVIKLEELSGRLLDEINFDGE